MAQIVKKGPSYMVRVTWYDHTGKQHKKSKSGFKTKAQARKFAAEMEAQKYNGQMTVDDPTFTEYFKKWYEVYKKNKVSLSAKKHYLYCIQTIEQYFGKQRLSSITRHQFQEFVNAYGQGRSKSTVQKTISHIKSCVRFAFNDGQIKQDFTANAELVWDDSKTWKIQYLSTHEINLLVAELLKDRQPAYITRYMIITAVYTGMRIGEIAALTWNDINFNFRTITINKSWNYAQGGGFKKTKTEKSKRIIRVNAWLLKILKELQENSSDLVFFNPKKQTVPSREAANRTLRKFMKKCDIDKPSFHFHSLRHSHVALLLSHGVPLYAISKRLGHSSMTTTANKYAYLIDEFKARSDDQIENILSTLGVTKSVPTQTFL